MSTKPNHIANPLTWTNNAYWLLRLCLKPGAWAEVRSVAQAAWQATRL